jgi:hypothetical protein
MQCELNQQFENLLKADFVQMVSRHEWCIHILNVKHSSHILEFSA